MYGVARVVVTARQRDRLSSQQAARWPAKRHVKQPGLQVVETPMMAGATASGERSARLARANPVVASMAGASVTVPRQEPAAKFRCAAPAQCYCARGETAAVTAPAGALCCPPDRPGALRVGSGRCTSAVSWCVGATGRLQTGRRAKV